MKHYSNLFLASVLSVSMAASFSKSYSANSGFFQEKRDIVTEAPNYNGKQKSSLPPNIDFTQAAEKGLEVVVHLKNIGLKATPKNKEDNYQREQGDEDSQKTEPKFTGSGVIISDNGYIVTNNHMVKEAAKIEITLNNNKQYIARVIGSDPKMDIALLKIDTNEKLPYVTFANSDLVKVGEWVLVVGDPYFLNSTVTAGIISAKIRTLSDKVLYIQTDAAVNPGASGGALVNTRGELIGIASVISSPTGSYAGYSFAVPSNITRKIVKDIMEFGKVQSANIDMEGMELDAIYSEEFGIAQTQGYYIAKVNKNSEAEKAGLQKGDVIVKIDNQDVRTTVDLLAYIYTKRPNDKVQVTVSRDGKNKTIHLVLSPKEFLYTEFKGMELENMDADDQKKFNLKEGVKIKSITNKSLARYKNELVGNIIISIDNVKVTNIETVEKLLSNKGENEKIRIEMINQTGEISKIYI